VLKRAGILEAPAVVITTNDDDMNVYLTVYCRKLRPDIQIISRATEERTVSTLHRAGADTVVSYASLGATIIINHLRRGDIVMLAEGLELFRIAIPERLVGKAVRECGVREQAGCSVAAIESQNQTIVNPTPDYVLPEDGVMILLGNAETEARFMDCFVNA
jgi:Trk K+ transport system NAD-binding subunit